MLSAQTEFPELQVLDMAWVIIWKLVAEYRRVIGVMLSHVKSCPRSLAQAHPTGGLMVLSPDNCQHQQHSQSRKSQEESLKRFNSS